jgi:DNA repair protein RadC
MAEESAGFVVWLRELQACLVDQSPPGTGPTVLHEPSPTRGTRVRRRPVRAAETAAAAMAAPEAVGSLLGPERPRERLTQHGAAALSAAELIGVLWGTGTRGTTAVEAATDALERHAGLIGLARATDVELETLRGVGPVRAAQLAAAFELGRRVVADWPAGRWVIRSPRDVGERLVPQMGFLEREELRVVVMNTRNAVLRLVTVYQGNVSSSLVRIAELFRDAVRLNAAGLILVHNHPSGDPTPSPDDLRLTAEALAAGRLLDIQVLDHLIVAGSGFVSLRDRGVAFDRPS